MDSRVLGTINEGVFAGVGGTGWIDTYLHDSVAYGLKYGHTKLTDTPTLFVPDPIHRMDGVLLAVIDGVPALVALCSGLKNVFKRTNRSWASGFYKKILNKGFVSTRFPAPGETRAWTGKYRTLEWLYAHFDPLEEYVRETFPVTKDPSDKFKALHLLLTNHSLHDLKVVVVWALQYCADFVVAITGWQSRVLPTMQLVYPVVEGMIRFMNYSNDELKSSEHFKGQVMMEDNELFGAYKDCDDKPWVKKGIIGGIARGRIQILKNWGEFSRKARADVPEGEEVWDLHIEDDGDVFKRAQLSFFAVAGLLDPRNRTCQTPPSMDVLRDGFPWNGMDEKLLAIQQQMRRYLTDASIGGELGGSGNLRLFWKSLGKQQRVKYGALSRFAVRVLATPGGSAEVERAVSAYNAIVTTDRLALKNENIRSYVMIYANNPERKEKNTNRAETRAKLQKQKKDERQYGWRSVFEPPKAK
jgi:hypothetical protein